LSAGWWKCFSSSLCLSGKTRTIAKHKQPADSTDSCKNKAAATKKLRAKTMNKYTIERLHLRFFATSDHSSTKNELRNGTLRNRLLNSTTRPTELQQQQT
jgi:hypothetical protein